MTLDQALAFGILLGTIALFVWGRLPYDLTAVLGLLAAVVTGIVPMDKAFDGFNDDAVVLTGAALLVSAAIARSGAMEGLLRPLLPHLKSEQAQVTGMMLVTALLSMFTENVGVLAVLLPVALQLCRRTGAPPAVLLMPMSFAALLGGMCTMIGTSTNVLVAKVRGDLHVGEGHGGEGFGIFSFTPVGLGVAAAGILFLSVAYRLLPRGRKAASGIDSAFNLDGYTAEVTLPRGSPGIGRTVAELERLGDGFVTVAIIIRERFRRLVPTPAMRLAADDVLLLEGEPADLERLVARARLRLAGGESDGTEASVVEGVVTAESSLVGRTPLAAGLGTRHKAQLLAVSRSGQRITQRLGAVRFRTGDVVALRGASALLPDVLGELRILPLAERQIALGQNKRSILPILVLLAAVVLVAAGLVPVALAFFGAAAVLLLLRVLTMEEAYRTVEWPILILVGALIPLGNAIKSTGGTDLIATGLSTALAGLPATAALAAMLVTAICVTPFLNNAIVVLMLGPIAASLADKLGLNADPFLIAVALGTNCDFLTPIGHQCNTLVMGPGGYRFNDYPKLGIGVIVLVVLTGVPLIAWVWPLAKG